MTLVFGFTGPRTGMNAIQRQGLRQLLEGCQPDELHHGACIGSDELAHDIAIAVSCDRRFAPIHIVIHPPVNTRYMMNLEPWQGHPFVTILPPKPYLVRDLNIVKVSHRLLATPKSAERVGGTWFTINCAERQSVERTIFWPDGRIERQP